MDDVAIASCKHCGATTDLVEKANGRPSTVCRPCRRAQVNRRRGSINAEVTRTMPRHLPKPYTPRRPETEAQSAIRRAQARAKQEGIPLSKALELEGMA